MAEARYSMVDLICRKRDGGHLSENEIKWIIPAYCKGEIPDYQMSSLLMAINFTGMTREETRFLTESMLFSGERINLSHISGVKVDKHSTGGVGDKISLILAPVMAAAGVIVPMMSGRGLGHTGGTLDKLEAIPGLTTTLSVSEFKKILNKIGFAMIGQTEKIVPADGKLYALRDVSGTVPSIPLICSSIISKKMAEGTDALVLDVKFGKGAFMQQKSKAEELANNLVALGNDCGLRTSALLTNMDEPLGYAVGNWPETKEAIEALKGKGPEDVREL
ncbi:MAG: thymidine phosphorylase, partial [bacterium]